jgi:hypothetical protein
MAQSLRSIAHDLGLTFGETPDVKVGELFYHPSLDIVVARTDDTEQGDFTSVVVFSPRMGYIINDYSVDDSRLGELIAQIGVDA